MHESTKFQRTNNNNETKIGEWKNRIDVACEQKNTLSSCCARVCNLVLNRVKWDACVFALKYIKRRLDFAMKVKPFFFS